MSETRPGRNAGSITTAIMGSSVVIMVYQVASRATRDTLYLSNFPVTSLPLMVALASALSIGMALLATRAASAYGPARVVPVAFLGSALLTVAEWGLALRRPDIGAIAVYLHVSALGPALISGFWSLLNERIDPRTAKRAIGRIAGIGTLGGLAGGVLAERITAWTGVTGTLPVLALAHLGCAWTTSRLPALAAPVAPPGSQDALPAREAVRRLLATPYLRNLALLVLGSSVSVALLDFVFKAQASGVARQSLDLMRVFSAFYALVALFTFAIQTLFSRLALERAGLAATVGTLPSAVVAGGVFAALVPGPWGVAIARGVEAVVRGSLFRAGYELLYTPIPPAEKRATKTLVDVGFERLGDGLGAGITALVLLLVPLDSTRALLWISVLLAGATLAVVGRIQRGYVSSLEAGLRAGALRLDPRDIEDSTTRATLALSLRSIALPAAASAPRDTSPPEAGVVRETIQRLARDDSARQAAEALAPMAERHLDVLIEALLDPGSPLAVRRRIPGILARVPAPGAVEGLTCGLADERFEVRYRCGRALAHALVRESGLRVDGERVLAAVRREAALGRRVWESQRLLDRLADADEGGLVDELLRDRAGRNLEHVFTLLSLVLPREPMRIAFRGLHTGDPMLRGTALEYLEGVLPPPVRDMLWPYLEPERSARPASKAPSRDREQVLSDLMRSNQSIEIQLEALRRSHREASGPEVV